MIRRPALPRPLDYSAAGTGPSWRRERRRRRVRAAFLLLTLTVATLAVPPLLLLLAYRWPGGVFGLGYLMSLPLAALVPVAAGFTGVGCWRKWTRDGAGGGFSLPLLATATIGGIVLILDAALLARVVL